jgi:murein DD-endopeptidase MepM/ murein hydrolase activator NlpD
MHLRRTAVAAALLGLVTLVGTPAHADSSSDAKRRVADASAALEDSTAAVRTAAARLASVKAQLPAARQAVATAHGELAGAQARRAEATSNVRRAQLATAAAQRQVDEATANVDAGQTEIGLLARRSYQEGPLGDMRQMLETGSPQDLVDKVSLLHQVFRSQNDALQTLRVGRLHLATATAGLAAQQKDLEKAQAVAAAGEERARALAVRADQAAARVTQLVEQGRSALADAKSAQAADQAAYQKAQADSARIALHLRNLARARAAAAARNHISIARPSSARFIWPTDGYFTSPFGWRMHPIFHVMRFHAGIDIGAPYGTAVWAADAGTVVYAGEASGYGTLVLVDHGTVDGHDLVTGYAHMSELDVAEGHTVARGQQVGRVGNEGNSTGPHLHFEVRLDGNPVQPLDYVSAP